MAKNPSSPSEELLKEQRDDASGRGDQSSSGMVKDAKKGTGESPDNKEDDAKKTDHKGSVNLGSEEDAATGEKTKTPGASGLYSPSVAGSPQSTGLKFVTRALQSKKAKGGFGALFAAGLLIIFSFAMFTNSFQLVGIKEAYTQNIGGVQHTIIRRRSNMLYSKGFFFSDDGAFDGWKSRGKITSIFTNYKTTQLIGDLRKSGLDIVPEKVNGVYTGNIGAIFKDGEEIFNIRDNDNFKQSLAEGKTVLNTALDEQYPSRSRTWRSRATRNLYKRYNLNLNNWLTGKLSATKLGQAFNDLEVRFTSALREKMFGTPDADVNISARAVGDEADDVLEDATKQADNVAADAAKEAADLLDNPDLSPPRVNPTALVTGVGAKVTSRTLASLNIVSNADTVCSVKRVADAVAVGSRVLRSAQLMKYALALWTIADATKTGDATGEEVGAVMNYLSKPNPDTGENFFSSGAWRLVSGDKTATISQDNLSKYSVSGGLSGFFQAAMFKINSAFGGTGKTSCKVVGNMLVQLVGGGLSVGLAIFTGGGSVGISAVVGATLGAAVGFLEIIAKPILTTLVAGTVIHGGEYSDEAATALYTGTSVLNQKRNSNYGMGAMTIPEAKLAYAEHEIYLAEQRSQESLYEKYISFENPNSMRSKVNFATYAYTGSGISGVFNGVAKIFDFSHLRSFFSSFGQVVLGRANADTDNSVQPCLWDEELACDAVGVAITGEDMAVIDNLDAIKNLKWMVERDYMDGDGEAIVGSEYAEYIDDCFGVADPYYDKDNTPTKKCYEDGINDKYLKFRMAHIDWNLARDISEDINREYRGPTEATSATPVSVAGTVSGTTQELAQQILDIADSGGNISFRYGSRALTFEPLARGEEGVINDPDGIAWQGPTTDVSTELLRIILEISKSDVVPGLILGSVTSGGHSDTSTHFLGRAVDISVRSWPADQKNTLFRYIYDNSRSAAGNFCIGSLIHHPVPSGTSTLFQGRPHTFSPDTLNGHRGHIHLSVTTDTIKGCEAL